MHSYEWCNVNIAKSRDQLLIQNHAIYYCKRNLLLQLLTSSCFFSLFFFVLRYFSSAWFLFFCHHIKIVSTNDCSLTITVLKSRFWEIIHVYVYRFHLIVSSILFSYSFLINYTDDAPVEDILPWGISCTVLWYGPCLAHTSTPPPFI